MAERKVLNKYFPPDFDPSLIPRGHKDKEGAKKQQAVRLMAPFSMRCKACGEYIYKGKKFNARKETVQGEEYYGIKIFRFYIKCPQCSSEITFKTDPKNTDYAVELGAERNHYKTEQIVADNIEEDEPEETDDVMANLEQKGIDSKREMAVLDGLQLLKEQSRRREKRERGEIILNEPDIESTAAEAPQEVHDDDEIEREVKEVFNKESATLSVKRKLGSTEPSLQDLLSEKAQAILSTKPTLPKKKRKNDLSAKLGIKVARKA